MYSGYENNLKIKFKSGAIQEENFILLLADNQNRPIKY